MPYSRQQAVLRVANETHADSEMMSTTTGNWIQLPIAVEISSKSAKVACYKAFLFEPIETVDVDIFVMNFVITSEIILTSKSSFRLKSIVRFDPFSKAANMTIS